MANETLRFRIRKEDYKILKDIFPPMRRETAADYFGRVVAFLHQRKYKNYAGVKNG